MFQGHFYHATIRKIVSVFGTLFNNISVVRKDATGKAVNITRVPLAYGPKQKFLARLDEQPNLDSTKVAIKLPRMSFEITSLTYDATIKTNRNNTIAFTDPNGSTTSKEVVRNYAPYRMALQLSIMAKNQDDALQIMEQILPHFQPEYTVTIKELGSLNLTTDVPFVLTGVTMQDDYEGDFTQRRAIIYTLDFETRLRFYGPVNTKGGIIKDITINAIPDGENGKEKISVTIDPISAGPKDPYTVVTAINFVQETDACNILLEAGTGTYQVGETVIGDSSGTKATVTAFYGNILGIKNADGVFTKGENLTGQNLNTIRVIDNPNYYYPPSPLLLDPNNP